MKTTEVPESACISCGKIFDVVSDVLAENMPIPGDVSICLYCGELAIFDKRMMLRPLKESEISAIPFMDLQRLQAARLAAFAERKNGK